MSNVLYPKFKEALLKGDVDLETATMKVTLIDTADDSYSASDEFISAIAAAARVASVTLPTSGRTFTNGVFDAADVSLASVTGDVSEALLIWIDTGSEATSRLVAWFDSVTGLPVTPNGGDIDITWNASGIFSL